MCGCPAATSQEKIYVGYILHQTGRDFSVTFLFFLKYSLHQRVRKCPTILTLQAIKQVQKIGEKQGKHPIRKQRQPKECIRQMSSSNLPPGNKCKAPFTQDASAYLHVNLCANPLLHATCVNTPIHYSVFLLRAHVATCSASCVNGA